MFENPPSERSEKSLTHSNFPYDSIDMKNVENMNYDILYKIVVTGDSSVGKTRLLERFIRDEYNHNGPVTIGIEFTTKILIMPGGTRIKL